MEFKFPLNEKFSTFYTIQIFTDTLLDMDGLEAKIAEILDCPITDYGIIAPWADIEIENNPELINQYSKNSETVKHFHEGPEFIRWPFTVCCDFQDEKNITPEQYVKGVDDLVNKMLKAQFRFVVDSRMTGFPLADKWETIGDEWCN